MAAVIHAWRNTCLHACIHASLRAHVSIRTVRTPAHTHTHVYIYIYTHMRVYVTRVHMHVHKQGLFLGHPSATDTVLCMSDF